MRGLLTLGFIALLLIGGGILAFGYIDVDVPQTEKTVNIPINQPAAPAPQAPAPQVIQ